MSFLATCLALVLSVAGNDASLHPAESDLFLEVPDLPALMDAYDQAPMMRMLRDEEIRSAMTTVMGMDFDIDEQLNTVLPEMLGEEMTGLLRAARSLSISLQVPEPSEGEGSLQPWPTFQVLVDLGTEDQARIALDAIVNQANRREDHATSPLAGTHVLHFDDFEGLSFWAVVDGSRLVMGRGACLPSGFVARRDGTAPTNLSTLPDWAATMAPLEAPRGATVVRGYSSRSPLDFLAAAAPEEEDMMMGLGMMEEVLGFEDGLFGGRRSIRMQLVDGRFLTEMVTLDDPETSASPSILGGRDLDPAWLTPIDSGNMLVYASAMDGQALLSRIQTAIDEFGQATGQEDAAAAVDADLAAPLEAICGLLGPGLTVHAKPLKGLSIPETFLRIDVQDRDAFQAQLAILIDQMGGKFPDMTIRTRDYRVKNRATGERRAFPITSLTLPSDWIDLPLPISLSPSLVEVDGTLLVCQSSMQLKRELKRLYGGRSPEPAPEGEMAAAVPTIAALTADLPPAARSFLVMDWGLVFEGVLSAVKGLGAMFGLPFDVQSLPEPEVITRFFEPTVHWSQRIEGGTYRRHEASFGPEVWLGLGAAGFLGMRSMEMGMGMGGPMTPPDYAEPPVPVEVEGDPHELQTRATMAMIRTAIAIHQLELGTFPATLGQLIEPTTSFPGGFLDAKEVPSDAWGNAFRYELGEDGRTYRLWSPGPNGADDGGAGDDIVGG